MDVPHEQLEKIVTKLDETAQKAEKLLRSLKRSCPRAKAKLAHQPPKR